MFFRLLWAYLVWCFFKIFGGTISKHHQYVNAMRYETVGAIVLSCLFGLLLTGASIIIALVVGPEDLGASRALAGMTGYVVAICITGYITLVGIIASWKNFCADRQDLLDSLRNL